MLLSVIKGNTLEKTQNIKIIEENPQKIKKPLQKPQKTKHSESLSKDNLLSLDLKILDYVSNDNQCHHALVDTGASGCYMSESLATRLRIPIIKKANQVSIIMADASSQHQVCYETIPLRIHHYFEEQMVFDILPNLQFDIILGSSWLRCHRPTIDWTSMTLSFPDLDLSIPDPDSSNFDSKAFSDLPALRDHSVASTSTALLLSCQKTSCDYPDLPEFYKEFQNVFSEEMADILPENRKYDCPIDLIDPGSKPPFKPIYHLSPKESECLRTYIDENLKKGFIRPSKSPFGSPIFFVPKKDESLRPCVDYRDVNALTVKNRHPLPLINEMMDRFNKAKIFTKIDLRGAYNLVRMRKGDEHKTAFRCQFGHFEYTVMPFGLTNAPAIFQGMMFDIFRDVIDIYVVIYLDDILIFSENEEDHIKHVKTVLSRLESNSLYAKLKKCSFHATTVEFLGFVISANGISMAKDKVDAVMSWSVPKSPKEIMSFLGFTNFYRRFIPNYSALALPLTSMLKKDSFFKWSQPCQDAFDRLKAAVTSDSVLHHVHPDLPFLLETDASNFAIGAVLSQFPTSDTSDITLCHPVAFFSRKFLPAEINYTVHDKELLAIVDSFKHWRHYLLGTSHPVLVLSDHRNLEYFRKKPILRPRHARWSTTLSDFDFRLVYRPGTSNTVADALSRSQPPSLEEGDNSSPPSILKPVNWSLIATINQSSSDLSNNQIQEILQQRHDSKIAGHPGRRKTYELIRKDFIWPKMVKDINQYVKSCQVCQRNKSSRRLSRFPLKPLPVPNSPWSVVSLDFITDLPKSNNFDSILVIVDHFTKMSHFVACTKEIDSKSTANLFLKIVFCKHGLPSKIISDRGPQFVAMFWENLFALAGVKCSKTSAFHPQSNGLSERTNQSLEQYLRCFVNYEQDNWVDLLPFAEFSYNNSINASTGMTPFYANYGYHPRSDLLLPDKPVLNVSSHELLSHLNILQNKLYTQLVLSKERMLKSHGKSNPSQFNIGDLVWVKTTNISSPRPCPKLDHKKRGPFKIIEKLSPISYKLELPLELQIHPVFHIGCLEAYTHRSGSDSELPSADLGLRYKDEYFVDKILDSKIKDDQIYYLISWKDYSSDHDSWEPLQNVTNCLPKIRQFHNENPSKPRPSDKLLVKRRIMLRK